MGAVKKKKIQLLPWGLSLQMLRIAWNSGRFPRRSCQFYEGPKLRKLLSAIIVAVAITACSSDDEDTYIARDVEVLYNLGVDQLGRGRYAAAAALFDEVERQHPYSVWARRSQLMAAYSHYQANEYEDSILSAERFLTLHPGNPSASYAYYLIAMSHYEQITDIGRDQRQTEQALAALQQVIRRFPNTEYARDAKLKLDLTRDHLAGKDMEVGRFYLRQKQYLAAIGRFRSVIENYQTTSHTPEALHRLVESYLAIGIVNEAQTVAAVLGHNFPDSKWYRYSYSLLAGKDLAPAGAPDERSWLKKIFDIF